MMNNKIEELGMLATQYERYGTITIDEVMETLIDELEVTASMIPDYNEWLLNNNYYDDYIYSELDEMLEGLTPFEIVQKTFYGKNFNPYSDYFRFNGYANIDGLSEYEVIREMQGNNDFLKWYLEEYELPEDGELEEIIAAGNKYLKMGY